MICRMSSSHRCSASSSRQRGRNVSNETRTRSTDRFKWTYEQEKKLIELFDHAISMNKYTLKDPTALGRDYIVEQFNLAFNMNITYGFFKNKLDEFKKSYKMWKFLMKSTGISGCRLTKSFNREPPKFWDIMMMIHILQMNLPMMQLESILEEVNNVEDVGVVHTLVADEGVVCTDQVEAQELILEVVHEEVGENNHLRQQCKKLLLDLKIFNDKVYNNFFLVRLIKMITMNGKRRKRYSLIYKLQNILNFIGNVLIHSKTSNTDEDKLQLLEAMTGVSRNNEDIPKQLVGNTTKRTTLGHTAKCATMGHTAKSTTMGCTAWFSTWSAPSTAQQWGTPPTAPQWGTPPNAQQWGTPPNAQQWNTPPNAQQWGTPPNANQWGTPPNAQQWGTQSNVQQWDTPTSAQQWGVKDLIMEITNQPERIQLMFNMDFRWTIIMKFQIAQQKELRLIPNNHNHSVLVSQVVLILEKIHDNPEQE
ncbi:hypothetical protein HID58_065118, partial [Brassica napus]